ncbi:uncharacterized protein F5Z01DRAFT_665973 [Emericellopsis atlantica]|uniref:Uncharacterized protein n=1 Tax=Emericellopsis atlantica TaxID=2614577 RepID=A0A9P7ZFN7_9HYPO|nr:uncharacterized protein F5Z01DRAFT_665973 [Emericellopsis atlantica]KAG9250608.1 hypothetical protein F5Z01DRAFT_665973 [Emericellopsis atlantica]
MAPAKRAAKFQSKTGATAKNGDGKLPAPFKKPSEVLQPFIDTLSPKHVYITHIDNHPADFKRKIFVVPVLMNIAIVGLFCLRVWWIVPYYIQLLANGLGQVNEATIKVEEASWAELAWEIGGRALNFFFDFILVVFVWPWPLEFAAGWKHGNPCQWRWVVGFRQQEIYVRRSREWDTALGNIFVDKDSMKILTHYIADATNPMRQEQKTGYLLMNGQWDLDWAGMVTAHTLVDKKEIAIQAFNTIVLLHTEEHGWLQYDVKKQASTAEDGKRRQLFAFRDALTRLGKEDLFYRWVELVQYEADAPGGFTKEKQDKAANKIRELFDKEGVDFDQLWRDTVGADASAQF